MMRLKEIRKSKKLSQQQMADYLCIQRNSYTRYENGNRMPDHDTLLKIANYLDVSLDYLFGRTDDPVLYVDTKKDPSPSEREQALNVAQAALNGEAAPAMPADVKALSELVRQIVDQALEERDQQTDGQS